MTHHEHQDDEPDFTERAADATEESRRTAGEEDRKIEDQREPLAVEEDGEETSAY